MSSSLRPCFPSCTCFIPWAFAFSDDHDCHPEWTCTTELNGKSWEDFSESRPHQVPTCQLPVAWSCYLYCDKKWEKSKLKALYHLWTVDSVAAIFVIVGFFVVGLLGSRSPQAQCHGSPSLAVDSTYNKPVHVQSGTCGSVLFFSLLC